MNLASISLDTAIWAALITGVVILFGYYLVHRFTQIRERENFEREIKKLELEKLLKKHADLEGEIADLEKGTAEIKMESAKLHAESASLRVESLILMEQLKDENPELLEQSYRRYLKRKKAEDYHESLADDQKGVSVASWYLEQSERILSQDSEKLTIDEEE